MTTKLGKIGLLLIAAVMLLTVCAGAASADATNTTIGNWAQLNENITNWNDDGDSGMLTIILPASFNSDDASTDTVNIGITSNITIMPASNAGEVVLDAKQQGRLFYVDEGTLTLQGNKPATLKLINGTVDGDGGGVLVTSTGTFAMSGDVTIAYCNATGNGYGGGVYNTGIFTMSDTATIAHCSAGRNGGGVYNTGIFTMSDTATIAHCSARYGGGVSNHNTFNMIGGTITDCTSTGSEEERGGGGVFNTVTFNMTGGTITNCTAKKGGGVFSVNDGNTFNMSGDATISYCTANNYGGGVYYSYNIFNMSGGARIEHCTANTYYGGGVYNGDSGIFTMAGGIIFNCTAKRGGGVYNTATFTISDDASVAYCNATESGDECGGGGVYNTATFTMSDDASIAYCNATGNGYRYGGGGVYNYRTFNMTGGTITNCTSTTNGGGVYTQAQSGNIFNMSGDAAISNCKAAQSGGGVYNEEFGIFAMSDDASIAYCNATGNAEGCGGGGVYNYGTFTMTGGKITDCSAGIGGGVYNFYNNNKFTMTGGKITDCTAGIGSGVYNSADLTIGGSATITSDVALIFNMFVGPKRIVLDTTSFSGRVSNISLYYEEYDIAEEPGAWVGEIVVENGEGYKNNFTLSSKYTDYKLNESEGNLVLEEDLKPYVEVSSWRELRKAVEKWNATEKQAGQTRIVAVTQNITDRTDSWPDSDRISVYGNVILTTNASAEDSEFKIDGKGFGGLFDILQNGNLTLVGNGSRVLNLTGGFVDDYKGGGAIHATNANLNIADGVVISNCSTIIYFVNGGGISLVGSTAVITGGTITDCKAVYGNGGGISLDGSTVVMTGGNITNCTALSTESDGGGGIGFSGYSSSQLNISGTATITGNYNDEGDADNVHIGEDSIILNLVDDFSGKVGVHDGYGPEVETVFGSYVDGNPAGAANFFADKNPDLVGNVSGNNLVWVEKPKLPYVEVSTWSELNKSVAEWNAAGKQAGQTRIVAVTQNITDRDKLEEQNRYGIEVYGNVILTTNASPAGGNEVMIDGLGLGSLFRIRDGGNLTLCGNSSGTLLNLTGGSAINNGAGGVTVEDGAVFTMEDGSCISNCSGYSGGVRTLDNSLFTMNGGTITECKGYHGSGVGIFGSTFIMNNGSITDCGYRGMESYGGGVYIQCSYNYPTLLGTFIMNGGRIANCSAGIGDAVYSTSTKAFMMNGTATITPENDVALSVDNTRFLNITVGDSFAGNVGNITLYDESWKENPGAWADQVVVENGSQFSNAFNLSKSPLYEDCKLKVVGEDLVLDVIEQVITVSSNTVSFGTVDLNTSPAWNTIIKTLNVTNDLKDNVMLTLSGAEGVFTFTPAISSGLAPRTQGNYTIGITEQPVGDYSSILTITNGTVTQNVTLSLSVVNTSDVNQNTTIVPTVPKIETHTDESGKVTEVVVAENNVSIDAENTAHIKDSSSDNSVTIRITHVENESAGGKQTLTLTEDSIITTEYPVRKADLIAENTVKVVYQPTISSLNNFTVDNLPTLSGDFNESVNTTLGDSKYRGISMVSAMNKDISKLDEQINSVTIVFNISTVDVSGFSIDDLVAFKLHDDETLEILDKPDIESHESEGYYLVIATYPGGFSTDGICVPVSDPVTPTPYTPSHREQGQTQILQNGTLVTPTPTPTPAGNATILPTINPTQPTQPTTSKSPAPLAGIIAGLGAAALLMRMRR